MKYYKHLLLTLSAALSWAIVTILPVEAQQMPPAEFLSGTYELVGRAPGLDGALVGDIATLSGQGDIVVIESCRMGSGVLQAIPPEHEGDAPWRGSLGDASLLCRFGMDGDNYPRLTCYHVPDADTDAPGLLTFWPLKWDAPTHSSDCRKDP